LKEIIRNKLAATIAKLLMCFFMTVPPFVCSEY
jgi:hypothetical protein